MYRETFFSVGDTIKALRKIVLLLLSQPTITCLKLTIETLERGVKYVQS